MSKINRNLIFIVPTEACLAWARKVHPHTPAAIRNQPAYEFGKAFLILQYEDYEKVMASIQKDWENWFNTMLKEWASDESLWPRNRSWELFNEYFEVVWQPWVEDTMPIPVKKEEETE
jgi:hypothetical protein